MTDWAEAASLAALSGTSTRWQQLLGYQPVASKANRPPLTSSLPVRAVVDLVVSFSAGIRKHSDYFQ